jgi:hypothetical protein
VLTDWKGWLLIALLAATGYAQDVGFHFEKLTGLRRISSFQTYRLIFGTAYPLFRWGEFIRIAGVGTILWLYGWRTTIFVIAGMLIFCLALWRVTRGHAQIMLGQVNDLMARADSPRGK